MSDDRVAVAVDDFWPEDTEEEEGIVVDWFVREGRRVEAGDLLCEIQVEKVGVDVTAPVGGDLVEVAVEEDGEFAHGDVLAWIEPG